MKTDYKDKIKKLLALAESPNENEARAALLKARQLMVEHKLTEVDWGRVEKQTVKKIQTEITCNKRKNPWIVKLSAVIGENYCCQGYRIHKQRKQTQQIGFVGLEDDVEICVIIFSYAVSCVLSELNRIKKETACYDNRYIKKLCDSYGYGFTTGVQEAFQRQQKENKQRWGLVLVMPKEVQEAVKDWSKQMFKAKSQEDISNEAYTQGYEQGKQFNPNRRLATNTYEELQKKIEEKETL